MMMKKILSCALALIAVLAVDLQAKFVSPETELKRGVIASFPLTIQSPVSIFKSTGGKYPYQLTYRPAQNELTTVLFGAQDENGIRLVKSGDASDLVNLTPASTSLQFLDARLKITRKYFREAFLANVVSGILTVSGLLPRETYKGTCVVDEMQAGIAMKWVLQNPEELRGMQAYIEAKTAQNNITFTQKPLLLIDLLQGSELLTANDYNFLNKYFTLVSPTDTEKMEFYDKATAILMEITTSDVRYSNVAESCCQRFLRQIEDDCNGFKTGDMLADGAKVAFWALTGSLIVLAANELVGNQVRDVVRSGCTKIKTSVRDCFSTANAPAVV